jgi:membrane carboxypeptidase/penicillin-binding protein
VAAAYTVYPNLGVRIEPQSILRIEDRNGNVLRSFEPKRRRVLDAKPAFIMLSILRDVVDRGTARFGVRGQGFSTPAGGKTGTTNESTDSWFVGFTPKMLTLVWTGLDKKQRIMFNGTGGLLAAPTWTAFMKKVVEKQGDPGHFSSPSGLGLNQVSVARTSGLLSASFCRSTAYTEYFIPGTEPQRYCSPLAWTEEMPYGVDSEAAGGTAAHGAPPDSAAMAPAAQPAPAEPPRVDETFEF